MLISMARHLFLSVCGSALFFYSTSVAGQLVTSEPLPMLSPKFPPGIYWLGPREQPVPEAILRNSLVRGVALRMRWQDIESREGSYNWSYFDEQIKRAAQSGKAVSVRVASGGRNTPEWVMKLPGVEKFSFTDRNPYHKETIGEELTVPIFWNQAYLEKKKQFIQAWGARYGTSPYVVSVDMACANARTNDWNVPAHTEQEIGLWRKLGYTPEKLIAACKEILDVTMASFPDKVVILAISGIKLDKPQSRVPQTILDYAYARYPGRFMAIQANFSAKTPDPRQAGLPGIARLLFEHRPHTGAQMLWGASQDPTFRMNGGKERDRKEIFRQAMQTALNYGVSFLEVYQQDLLNPEFAEIISSAAAEISTRRK